MQSKSSNYALKVIENWRKTVRRLLMPDVPKWYRFLGRPQIKAAEQLMVAIRDDLEQQSTHRVLGCLHRLGINPVVNASQVNLIMRMCNGDDLAFIWFLWEMYYKTNPKTHMLDSHADVSDPDNTKPYSSNEQILLSSIFRLDLYPLLTELDRVLPLGHPPLAKLAKAKPKKSQQKKKFEEQRKENLSKREFRMPYFEPITMPRKFGSRMAIERPPTTAFYLRSPNDLKIPGGKNFEHWFSNYKLGENQNMVMSLLRREVKTIFDSMVESGVDYNDVKSLCVHHKMIDTMEKSLVSRLKLIALERAMRYKDVNAKSQEARRQRIVNELEQASEGFLERFRAEAQRTRMQATRKELFVRKGDKYQLGFCKPDIISVDGALSRTCGQRLSGGAEKLKKRKQNKTQKKAKKKPSEVEMPRSDPMIQLTPVVKRQTCTEIGAGDAATSAAEEDAVGVKDKIYDCGNGFKYISNREVLLCPPNSAEIGSRSFIKMCESDVAKNMANSTHSKQYQSGKGNAQTKCVRKPTTQKKSASFKLKHGLNETNEKAKRQCQINNSYFKMSPNDAGLYRIDYEKIFDEKAFGKDELWMKTEFIKAVNTDIDLLNKLLEKDPDTVIADAVHREALRIFRLDESYFKRTYARLDHRYYSSSDRLDFCQTVFDPDDNVLMNKLLRLAMKHIALNPNMVGPSLPNVWNIPFLKEWIRYRYGKRYTLSERERLYKISRAKMMTFTKMFKHWILPTPIIARKIHKLVDYNTRNCLMTRTKLIRNEYNKLFSELTIEAGRGFLFEMHPRHCSTRAIDTFYAYMPARRYDINFSVTKT